MRLEIPLYMLLAGTTGFVSGCASTPRRALLPEPRPLGADCAVGHDQQTDSHSGAPASPQPTDKVTLPQALAQALLHNPDLVLLDEPLGGLDPLGRKEIRDIVVQLREEGKTVFLSSHILQDIEMILKVKCDSAPTES